MEVGTGEEGGEGGKEGGGGDVASQDLKRRHADMI